MEEGAVGPDKDCGYEGPFLKAITGIPISMEGKTAACAHLSPLGNIASACADLWSNESVQNIKLLSGMAPTAYMEQLEYDARLMNEAIRAGKMQCQVLQQLLVASDIYTRSTGLNSGSRKCDPYFQRVNPGRIICRKRKKWSTRRHRYHRRGAPIREDEVAGIGDGLSAYAA